MTRRTSFLTLQAPVRNAMFGMSLLKMLTANTVPLC
ncbi:hypothetical protein PanWU01x14_191630, partial [Parasponia andersonii]